MPLRMGFGSVSRVLRGDDLGTAGFGMLRGGGRLHFLYAAYTLAHTANAFYV